MGPVDGRRNRQGSDPKRPGYDQRCHWYGACLPRGDRQREGLPQCRRLLQSAGREQWMMRGIIAASASILNKDTHPQAWPDHCTGRIPVVSALKWPFVTPAPTGGSSDCPSHVRCDQATVHGVDFGLEQPSLTPRVSCHSGPPCPTLSPVAHLLRTRTLASGSLSGPGEVVCGSYLGLELALNRPTIRSAATASPTPRRAPAALTRPSGNRPCRLGLTCWSTSSNPAKATTSPTMRHRC